MTPPTNVIVASRNARAVICEAIDNPFAADSGSPLAPDTLEVVTRFLAEEGLAAGANFFVQGGYFQLPEGPNGFSVATMRAAASLVRLLAKGSDNEARLAVLINDIRIRCGPVACHTSAEGGNDEAHIREGITWLAREANVETAALLVLRERAVKNRGLRRMKQLLTAAAAPLSRGLVIAREGVTATGRPRRSYYLEDRDLRGVHLFEDLGESKVAKCPLILAAFYGELMRYGSCLFRRRDGRRVVLIDFCGYADRDRVAAGAEVFQRLFRQPDVLDVVVVSVCTDCHGDIPAIFRHDRPGLPAFNPRRVS